MADHGSSSVPRAACAFLGVMALCCTPASERRERGLAGGEPVAVPLAQAFCSVVLEGQGARDMENDYLPHVIDCENGGAGLETLKAQAIAARSVAYYNMARGGTICDGQACQVYSCGATPTAVHARAVAETAGQYLAYASMLTYGFYVAGDQTVNAPGCIGASSSTERWVTYNQGRSGRDVAQTELGFVGPPGFGQNRGCMSQWGARCLENTRGYDHLRILRFFYGEDVQVLTAAGPCVPETNSALTARLIASGSDADPDLGGQSDFRVCAGEPFSFWFELENTGEIAWTDDTGLAPGTAVRLATPGGQPDKLARKTQISLNESTNPDVRLEGAECNAALGCRRTVFGAGAGIPAVAPDLPGLYTTSWRLMDDRRGWFGPDVSLAFEVVDCSSDAGRASQFAR